MTANRGDTANRPNVLFVLADDLGAWALGCAGNPEIRTPNLDRLAAGGLRFTNFFCASPVCSPARATLLTGRIPSQHGIHDWLRAGNSPLERDNLSLPLEYLAGQPGYTDVLAAHGYTCALSGKWHLGNSARPQKGFTLWNVTAGGYSEYYNAPLFEDGRLYHAAGYLTEVITDNALRFLDRLEEKGGPSGGPFYLGVHYTAPHSPWDRDQHPAELYDDYFINCPFASVPDEPMHPWQINSAPWGRPPQRRRGLLAGYFAAVTAMDRQIGRLLEGLKRTGRLEQTLVIFTGDNGMNMGHHGIYGKGNGTFPQNMYDTSVKVPAIFYQPGRVPSGRVNDGLLNHYDLAPTLLEYLALPPLPERPPLPGRSFAGLLDGRDLPPQPESAVVALDEYGPVRMLRTAGWKFVRRYPAGPDELFHLANDPDERENLAGRPEHRAIEERLSAGLESWFKTYASPDRDGRNLPVTGMGQVGPAAFAADWRYLINDVRPPAA